MSRAEIEHAAWRHAAACAAERRWWDAHEALESAWRVLSPGPHRDRVQAAIQVFAVAYKLEPGTPAEHGSRAGAARVLARASARAMRPDADPARPDTLDAWLSASLTALSAQVGSAPTALPVQLPPLPLPPFTAR